MGHEDSAANKLLASNCVACGKSLTDAVSANKGIGPICRDTYNYKDAIPITPSIRSKVLLALRNFEDIETKRKVKKALRDSDSRRAANLLVHFIALNQLSDETYPAIRAIKALGYKKLASKIEERLEAKLRITEKEGKLVVDFPFNEAFIKQVKALEGSQFDWEAKTWKVPLDKKDELWEVLRRTYSGESAIGPNGPFLIE